jgi:ribosome-associated translation inhibitor RaiA
MNVTVEAQNVELAPQWKQQVEERLEAWSDPRDPVISARSIVAYKQAEQPPAEVSLVVNLRGRNVVVTKRADTVDAALKTAMDCVKREIRQHYAQRSTHRGRGAPPREVADV